MGEADLVARAKARTGKDKAADQAVAVPASAAPPYAVKDGVIEAGAAKAETPAEQRPFDPAAWMHERIVHQILDFEKNLGADHEVGGRFVEGPSTEPLHIQNVASWGPDMIMFMGQFPDGRKFELLQHYSQVSMLLVAVPKLKERPRRIGFELLKHVKEQDHPWGDPIA